MSTKILFFANTTFIGGAERNILDLAHDLANRGYSVYIAALERGGPLLNLAKSNGINTFDPKFQHYLLPVYIPRIHKFLKQNNFDFILIYGLKLKIILIPIAYFLKKSVIISMIMGLDIWKTFLHNLLERHLMRFTSYWISNSFAAKKNAVSKEGKPSPLIYVIYNGLNTGSLGDIENMAYDKSEKKFRVITVANIQKDKGHFFFLKVIKKVVDIDPNISFEFIGNDFTKGEIHKNIKKMGLEKYVLTSGFVIDVRRYLHNFNLMVLPSFAESLPTSIIECMLEGVPVLATKVGGVPELIEHGKTGWLEEAGDVSSFVKQIIEIKKDLPKRIEISQNALDFASRNFDINKIADQYEELFNKFHRIKASKSALIKILRTQSRIVIGGPAKHTILLSKELNNKYFRTVLVGGASKTVEKSLVEDAQEEGVECHIIPEMAREIHFYDDFVSTIKLYNLIKKEKPLIFHSHTAKAGGIGRIAAYLAGVPLIFHTFHGHVFEGYFGKLKTKIFILIEKLLARISTKVIVISERQREDIVRKYKITKIDKVELIRLGFEWNQEFFKASDLNIREKYKISKNKFLIGIIGRLVPIKDHKLFFEIAEKLIFENNNDYYFLVIGDGELKKEFVNLVEKKGFGKYVTFTGWIDVNGAVYNELDLLLLTSINEGTPVTVIESLAAGTPVIARDVGGVADVMKLYDMKYLIKDRSSEKFIELIKYIKINLKQPSKNIQLKVQSVYSSERLVNDLKKLYRESF